MKLPRKTFIGITLLSVAVGVGITLTVLQEKQPEISVRQAAASKQEDSTKPEQTTAKVVAQEQATEQQPAQPTQTPQPQEAPAPKTPDELKTMASQAIMNGGDSAEEANCFVMAIERRYGWNNATEPFINGKIATLRQTYIGMCAAYRTLQNYGTSGAYPPGFQD